MGDMADMYDWGDPSDCEDGWLENAEENLSKCQWQTKDGPVIKFRNMETSHIKNCIAYIQREKLHISYATFSDYIDAFNTELERRENENERIRSGFKISS
jgi:hypothetical protein